MDLELPDCLTFHILHSSTIAEAPVRYDHQITPSLAASRNWGFSNAVVTICTYIYTHTLRSPFQKPLSHMITQIMMEIWHLRIFFLKDLFSHLFTYSRIEPAVHTKLSVNCTLTIPPSTQYIYIYIYHFRTTWRSLHQGSNMHGSSFLWSKFLDKHHPKWKSHYALWTMILYF